MSNEENTPKVTETDRTRRELYDQAGALLHQKYILNILSDHIHAHGFAGSTRIPLVIFLIAITRMFRDPVSCLIKGLSSSGKSFALRHGLRYVPKSAFHEFHGMSAKALVRNEDVDLKHKLLVVQELAGMDKEGLVFLRQLLTEGSVKYMTVDQGRDGYKGKVLKGTEGPTGAIMTTTKDKIHGEDETRFLTFHVDQSAEQIDRVIRGFEEKTPDPTPEELSAWHAVHDYVCGGSLEVSIPYRTELLSLMPRTHQRVLRDIPKLFALIRAHALLQQCRRDRDGSAVVATPEDYEVIYDLISGALAIGLEASVAQHIVDTVRAVLHLFGKTGRPISQVEIATYLGLDRGTVSKRLSKAVDDGFVDNHSPGQGRLHAYVPGERELPSRCVLPTPDRLRALIDGVKPDIHPADPTPQSGVLLAGAKFADVAMID